jgi:hypothetical protein
LFLHLSLHQRLLVAVKRGVNSGDIKRRSVAHLAMQMVLPSNAGTNDDNKQRQQTKHTTLSKSSGLAVACTCKSG